MRLAVVMGLWAVFLAGCGTAAITSAPPGSEPVEDLPDASDERSEVQYRLGSGDTLRINVFGEPDLSGDFEVDGTGQISLPLLGQTQAARLTVPEFEQLVEATLVEKSILLEPQVSAEVTNYRPYFILGEVGAPGQYPYSSGLTVMNAVATASGFTYRANQRHIWVTHADGEEEIKYRLSASTRVLPGDTIRIRQCLIC